MVTRRDRTRRTLQLSLRLPGVDQVLDALPSDMRDIVKGLLQEATVELHQLEACLTEYVGELQQRAACTEFLDMELARKLVRQCQALVAGIHEDTSGEHRRLIQAAVRYLILDEDSEGDTASPIGFDDDALVIELVAKAVGREDILEIRGEGDH